MYVNTVSWPLDPLTRIIVIGLPDPLIQGFIEQASGSADICRTTISSLPNLLLYDHHEEAGGSADTGSQ